MARATSEDIENHEPSERRIWHQLIRQNSKHSGEAENSVLLDAESFLGDIDSITLNETSTNVSDHVAGYIEKIKTIKKLKLYGECCDQIFLNMNQIVRTTLYFPWEVSKIFVLLQRPSFHLMLPAMLSGV